MRIYLASPFFNEKQTFLRDEVVNFVRKLGFDVFNPEMDCPGEIAKLEKECQKFRLKTRQEKIRQGDLNGLDYCDVILSILNFPDEGVGYERGYAFLKGLGSIDFFKDKTDAHMYNLMYADCNASVSTYEDLGECLKVFKMHFDNFKKNPESNTTFVDYLYSKLGDSWRKVETTSPEDEKILFSDK